MVCPIWDIESHSQRDCAVFATTICDHKIGNHHIRLRFSHTVEPLLKSGGPLFFCSFAPSVASGERDGPPSPSSSPSPLHHRRDALTEFRVGGNHPTTKGRRRKRIQHAKKTYWRGFDFLTSQPCVCLEQSEKAENHPRWAGKVTRERPQPP